MSIILDGTTGITTPDLIDSSLTSGRVVYAGASGNLTGSSGLTFDGTNLAIGTSTAYVGLQVGGSSDVGIAMSNSSSVTSGNRATIYAYNSNISTVGYIRFGAVTDNVGTDIQFGVRPAAGSVSEAMRITSAGNLLVGDTFTNLSGARASIMGSGGLAVQFGAATGTYLQVTPGGADGVVELKFDARSGDYPAATFKLGNAERMRITNAGNVGIGTSSPTAAQLVIKGDGATSQIRLQASTNTNQGLTFLYNYSGGYGQINCDEAGVDQKDLWYTALNHKFGRNTSSASMTLDSSGNLLVGDTAASVTAEKVSIRNNSGPALILRSTGNPSMRFYTAADNGSNSCQINYYAGNSFSIETISTTPIAFLTNNTERMRILESGHLCIGKTTTAFGTTGIYFNHQGQGLYTYTNNSDAGGAAIYLNRLGVDGIIQYFYKDTSAVGNISVTTSATAYNTSSDYRLKNTIAPITGALAKVAQLKPVTYKWNVNGLDGEGFIAHELAEVCPQAVTGAKDALDKDGKPEYQGIDVSFLVATLTAAIQEQQALIQSLKARLDAANL